VLMQRIVTAAVLLVLCIGALFLLPNVHWALLLLLMLLGAGREWARLAAFGKIGTIVFLALIAASAAGILGAAHGGFARGGLSEGINRVVLWSGSVFWLLVVPLWLASGRVIGALPALMSAGWLVLVPCWLALALLQRGPGQLLVLMGVVWVADSAAYFVGRRFGRHKLAPAISPGKTWEGLAGALAAVTLYYGLVAWGAAPGAFPVIDAWGFGLFLLIAVASVIGDLYESRIKRQAGVKDSGSLLPGHGGILDRIDALTSSMPLAALAMLYV